MLGRYKVVIFRILISFCMLVVLHFLNMQNQVLNLALYMVCFLIIGYDVLYNAVRNIFGGHIFDENFLMSLATVGAFFVSQYSEAVAVMLFYQVGETFQKYAVNRSRKNIAELMDIRPDFARLKVLLEERVVSPEEVNVGDYIIIMPGERIPLDCVITLGETSVDTSSLTGESVPRDVFLGEELLSGTINISGKVEARVLKTYGASTVSKILELVENASSNKSKSENFITKFARVYTPIVVGLALLLAVVPPLLISGQTFSDWVYRALVFLVISCPCALVISVPLSFFGGIGGASKKGILIKGSEYIETMSKIKTVVMDKTGTLTKGTFEVVSIYPNNITKEALLKIAALAESSSNHPISKSIVNYYGKDIDASNLVNARELSGYGITATAFGEEVVVGNAKLLKNNNIVFDEVNDVGTIIYVAKGGKYLGAIVIADTIKDDSELAIKNLRASGVENIIMLSGDKDATCKKVASVLKLDNYYSELLPGDKVERLKEILNRKDKYGKVAFVGDGINDAPALSLADVGIAMGGLGQDAAIESADVVIMDDKPSKIATAIAASRKTISIVRQNIVFALAVKAVVLILGAFSFANMWAAVFADVGVSVIAILNAVRALSVKEKQ